MDKILDTNGKPAQVQKMIMEFPFNHVNGVCEKLNKNGTCSIYEERPDICNLKNFRDRAFPDIEEGNFWRIETEACKILMRNAGYLEQEIEEIYAGQ